MSSIIHRLFVFFVFLKSVRSHVGVTLCACQPAIYEFEIDFNHNCDDKNVDGPGIITAACTIERDATTGRNVSDVIPTRVSTIEILELNQNLDIIAQTFLNGDYQANDTFRYISVAASMNISNDNAVPKAIQLSLAGTNIQNQSLVNFWLILFTNNCNVYPVIKQEEHIGWTTFRALVPPPEDSCPQDRSSTQAPSLFITMSPHISPTRSKFASQRPSSISSRPTPSSVSELPTFHTDAPTLVNSIVSPPALLTSKAGKGFISKCMGGPKASKGGNC